MKGIVFTEFLEMIAEQFSADMVDDIIEDAKPPSGGAYTAVGTYEHTEIVALLLALAKRTQIAPPDLLQAFGRHLFGRFVQGFPSFFTGIENAFDFLTRIEDIIHPQVHKLYPDAELPSFIIEEYMPKRLVLLYKSGRHFEDLAEGLILGCITHFGGTISVRRETVGTGQTRCERFFLEQLD